MNRERKQAILNVLNSLEVVDRSGGEDAYILVDDNEANRKKLYAAGVTSEEIEAAGDGGTFCILSLALSGQYADDMQHGKFVLWGPIDDELRYRVLDGEGTPEDAYRLLRELEPDLCDTEATESTQAKPEAV